MDPQPLQNVGLGLSITLRADAHHLLTDVWTSIGVVLGVGMVQLTGWLVLDPLIGLLVAVNIVWTGVRLLRDTAQGLLDRALPPRTRKPSPRSSHATRRGASGSMRCARGPPVRVALSRCTSSCWASGRCKGDTTSPSR